MYEFKNASDKNVLFENNQIALQYVDNTGGITQNYPYNPNGSIEGITGVCF